MILIITAVFPPEPVVSASMTLNLAEKLSEKYEVVILSPAPTRPLGYNHKRQELTNGTFKHIVLKSFTYPKPNIIGRMLESYSFGRHVVKYLKQNHDRIKCCYVNTWPLISQYMIIKYVKDLSVPIITHVQDTYPESITKKIPVLGKLLNSMLLPVDRYILSSSDRIITSGNSIRNHLVSTRDLQKTKVSMIYNWRNDQLFIDFWKRHSENGKNSTFTFMFLGNLCRTAAVNILIHSFSKANLKNSRLVIAGNGPEKDKLISLSRNLKNCIVEFWDASDKDVPEIQSKADVLLLNLKSNTAQFAVPSKLPAYMFSKKPVIACVESDSDTSSIIQDAECGWVVPPENIDALAEQMRLVVQFKKNELIALGENGFNYAMNNFSTDINLHRLVSVFTEAIEIKKQQEHILKKGYYA